MVNFIIGSAYWLPTLVPLALEAQRKGHPCRFFYRRNLKDYADVSHGDKETSLKQCCQRHGFQLKPIQKVKDYSGLTFLVEGDINGRSKEDLTQSGLWSLGQMHQKVSLVWNFDFFWTYAKYRDDVDHVIFPNAIYATHYHLESPKNLYLGHPKYELAERIPVSDLFRKFKLKSKKSYALVFYPKYTYFKNQKVHEKDLLALYTQLHTLGISVLVKTRDKDDIPPGPLRGDHYFVEESIESNTSIELLRVCRIAFLFSSAAVEECVMEQVPFVDFKVHKLNRLEFLHGIHSRILAPHVIHTPVLLQNIRDLLKPEARDSLRKCRQN